MQLPLEIYGVPCRGISPSRLSPEQLAVEIRKVSHIVVRSARDFAHDQVNHAAYRTIAGGELLSGGLLPLLREAVERNGRAATNTGESHPIVGQIATYVKAHPSPSLVDHHREVEMARTLIDHGGPVARMVGVREDAPAPECVPA
ncbi:MAG: hypothetical protein HY053_04925 [Proteobacteria bacterium]|nr:hypothetical protein [Pseudomonadota bacterium]